MTYCGLVLSIILMTLVAILSYIATILTVKLQTTTHAESLNDLSHKLIGKGGSSFLSALTLVFTYSCCVAYLVIAGNNIGVYLSLAGEKYGNWMKKFGPRMLCMLIYSLILPVPLTIPRKMSFLSSFSTFSIVCLFCYGITMIIKCSAILSKDGVHPKANVFTADIHIFNALAIYSLMFALPALILPILKPTRPGLKPRFRIVGTAFFSCYLFVLLPGSLAYVTHGADTPELILDAFDDKDIIILIIRFAFFIVVTSSYPVVCLAIVSDLSAMVFKVYDTSLLTPKKRAITLVIANTPSVLIAMVCPQIKSVLQIGVALGGCMTNFFFPALLWIFNSGRKFYQGGQNIACSLLALFGLVSSVIATYMAVLDVIRGG